MTSRHLQAKALGLVRRWIAVGIVRAVWVVATKLKQAVDISAIDGGVDDVAASVRVRVCPSHDLMYVREPREEVGMGRRGIGAALWHA